MGNLLKPSFLPCDCPLAVLFNLEQSSFYVVKYCAAFSVLLVRSKKIGRCHLWQLENINDFIIKSRYIVLWLWGYFYRFLCTTSVQARIYEKIRQKIGNNKTCAVYRGGLNGHTMAWNSFWKIKCFYFLHLRFHKIWLINVAQGTNCFIKRRHNPSNLNFTSPKLRVRLLFWFL